MLNHTKTPIVICLLVLSGCASRISLTRTDDTSATITTATCDSGEPAVELWRVTSRLNGETQRFDTVKSSFSAPVYVEPGLYEIEAGCNRGIQVCGHMKARLYLDSAPTIKVSVERGERIQLDCDATTGDLAARR